MGAWLLAVLVLLLAATPPALLTPLQALAAGQRFGVMAEFQPAPTMQQQQLQQQQQPGPGQDPAAFGGDGEVPELPADVNLEEQRMLMAAIQGGGYEGEIPGGQLAEEHGCPSTVLTIHLQR